MTAVKISFLTLGAAAAISSYLSRFLSQKRSSPSLYSISLRNQASQRSWIAYPWPVPPTVHISRQAKLGYCTSMPWCFSSDWNASASCLPAKLLVIFKGSVLMLLPPRSLPWQSCPKSPFFHHPTLISWVIPFCDDLFTCLSLLSLEVKDNILFTFMSSTSRICICLINV